MKHRTHAPGRNRPRLALATLLAMGFLGTVDAAIGAWLVTVDGSRIETAGPWRETARTVVFHTTRGVLASLRKREVDLQASRQLSAPRSQDATVPLQSMLVGGGPVAARTEEKVRPLEPLPEKSVLVLTDRDIARRTSQPDPSPPPARVQRYTLDDLEVVRWTRARLHEIDGFEIRGELRNATDRRLEGLGLRAVLYDRFGVRLGTADAFVQVPALGPGEESGFWVHFGRVAHFDAIRFEPHGAEARPRRP